MNSDERLTATQVVAHNLRRARGLRRWTQEEAAERLEPHLGVRWSKASFSAAERRGRQFSADEVIAFAAAFDFPLVFFFEIPPSVRTTVAAPGAAKVLTPDDLAGLLVGLKETHRAVARLTEQHYTEHGIAFPGEPQKEEQR
jgi:transcriptional regulator with XRE-family HTH domain